MPNDNTSATGGYIQPLQDDTPLADNDLDAVFQRAVVGMTGLPGEYVRPRWQGVTPVVPERNIDWCSIAVERIEEDDGPAIVHLSPGEGSDQYVRHEEIYFGATFYGPLAQRNALKLRDGLAIPQNLELLQADGVAFVRCEPLRSIPELFNQQWVKRYDLRCQFRRKVTREYPILNLLASEVKVYKDEGGDLTEVADIIIKKE